VQTQISINSNIILVCFFIASTATLGSLFFSEVMDFVPCTMCWYQRIFMYPLVVIFLLNILYPKDNLFKYTISLVGIGLLFSIYHNMLLFGFIPESAVPCTAGIPCSTKYLDWFGFITIPLLSFTAYFMLFVLLLINNKKTQEVAR
jgi:disulfide bond formation protein DsbB